MQSRFSKSRLFDFPFRQSRRAIFNFFTLLDTEFGLGAYLNVQSVFQTLLYDFLAVFFVYSCVVLSDLSEYFNVPQQWMLKQKKTVIIHVVRAFL